MTPNAETAAHLANHIAGMEPNEFDRVVDDVIDQLTDYATTNGCSPTAAIRFATSFIKLMTSRLQVLASQRAVH